MIDAGAHGRARMDRTQSTASITPDRVFSSSPGMSTSPPPVLPARVSALRDPVSQKRAKHATTKVEPAKTPLKSPRKRAEKHKDEAGEMESDDPAILLPRKRKRLNRHSVEPPSEDTKQDTPAKPAQSTSSSTLRLAPIFTRMARWSTAPSAQHEISTPVPQPQSTAEDKTVLNGRSVEVIVLSSDSESSDGDPPATSESPREAFIPPLTPSGLPCLIEAANRREAALEESLAAKARVEARKEELKDGKRVSRFLAREKTRTSGRMGVVLPFGMPFPAELEQKYDVSLASGVTAEADGANSSSRLPARKTSGGSSRSAKRTKHCSDEVAL